MREMVYEMMHRVGSGALTEDYLANDKAILTFCENTSGAALDSLSLGLLDFPETLVWMTVEWRVKIIRRPKYGEMIRVKTFSKYVKRIYSFRDYIIESEEGDTLVLVESKWVLFDLSENKIVVLTEEDEKKYKSEPGMSAFDTPAERFTVPRDAAYMTEFSVRIRDIDTSKHMHNTEYVAAALDALPPSLLEEKGFKGFSNFRISYVKEYKLGDTVKLYYTEKDGKHYVIMKDEEGALHACVAFFD